VSIADVCIVIGSGPAAHTAAIYLARAELKRERAALQTRRLLLTVLDQP